MPMILYAVGYQSKPGMLQREASRAAYAMLRGLLRDATGLPGDEWQLSKDERGKPLVINKYGCRLPDVSVSHSRGYIAAAVSTVGAVGIDLECRRDGRDLCGIAESSFGKSEYAEVVRHGEVAFYRIWTIREAMAKAVGIGLPMVVDRRDHTTAFPIPGTWSAIVHGRRWLLSHGRLDGGASLALAVATFPGIDRWPEGSPVTGESMPAGYLSLAKGDRLPPPDACADRSPMLRWVR